MIHCQVCGIILKKDQFKYCSDLCQSNNKYLEYIKKWQSGIVDGSRGVTARGISEHVRRYLIEKYGEKCSLCAWKEINPTTGKVPLEIDHINGSSEDNQEANLRIICPNCHSLSANFRNLNKGHGRSWRTNKYIKNISK
jgi:Zn finger protein HypA/HybF involved in hydrogenase expression